MTQTSQETDRDVLGNKREKTSPWRALGLSLLIAAGTLAPLARVWMAGLTLVHRDQTGQYAPVRWIAGQALREGRLPLWNPFCATGVPFLADLTQGALHPLSLVAALVFPSDGLDPLIGLYLLSAALGAGFLARTAGASGPACVLAGFAYGLSGYCLSMSSNMVNLAGSGSLPWIVAGLWWAGRRATPLAFAGGALAVAAGALSGDVQELAVATLCGLALAASEGGLRPALRALAAVCVGALLGAVQLVPSWSYLPLTNRVLPLPPLDVNQWDFAPWRLVEFLAPGFFWGGDDGSMLAPVFTALGHPTLFQVPLAESVYLGGATLILALFGVRSPGKGKLLLVLGLAVLWFALGFHLGARSVQNLLPVAKGFRYGEKFLPGCLALVATLAALGADRLSGTPRLARCGAFLAGALFLALSALGLALGTSAAGRFALGIDQGEPIRAHLAQGLPHALAAAGALAFLLVLAARGRGRLALFGMVALVWCSLAAAAPLALRPGHPEARWSVPPPPITAMPPGLRVLNLLGTPVRAPRVGWDDIDQSSFDLAASLTPNMNAWNRVDNLMLDAGLYPLRWFLLTEGLGNDIAGAARRYGVTHLIYPPELNEEGKNLVAWATEGGVSLGSDPRTGMKLYRIPHREWAYFPAEVRLVPDPSAALAAIRSGVEPTLIEAASPLPVARGEVTALSRGLERVELTAHSEGDATLVVNDAFWPGWRAWIDGAETPIYPADLLVRAVRWPAGRHTLVMRYQPPEVRLGVRASLAGVLLLAGVLFLLRRAGKGGAAL
jgi:hypothetical protein